MKKNRMRAVAFFLAAGLIVNGFFSAFAEENGYVNNTQENTAVSEDAGGSNADEMKENDNDGGGEIAEDGNGSGAVAEEGSAEDAGTDSGSSASTAEDGEGSSGENGGSTADEGSTESTTNADEETNSTQSGQEDIIDDAADEITCICGEECTFDNLNVDCPVCKDGAEQCAKKNAEPEISDTQKAVCICDKPCTDTEENADCPVCMADRSQCNGGAANVLPTEPEQSHDWKMKEETAAKDGEDGKIVFACADENCEETLEIISHYYKYDEEKGVYVCANCKETAADTCEAPEAGETGTHEWLDLTMEGSEESAVRCGYCKSIRLQRTPKEKEDEDKSVYSSNLKDFLTDVKILDGKGNAVTSIREKEDYTIRLEFAEMAYKLQFDPAGVITYTLPAGIVSQDFGDTGNQEFQFDGEKAGSWEISNNLLAITFVEGFVDRFINVSGHIEFGAKFTFESGEETKTFEIKDGTTISFDLDDTGIVSVEKTNGGYHRDTNEIEYTVVISSRGNNQNVAVKDIPGNSMQLKTDSFVITKTDSRGNTSELDSQEITQTSEKGFSWNIGVMEDGEKITITYKAGIKDSILSGSMTGKVKNTKNTVTVTADGDQKVTGVSDFDFSIEGLNKSAKLNDDGTITYTVKVNSDCVLLMGGKKIVDTIEKASQPYLTYKTDAPITITVRDSDGNMLRTDRSDGNDWKNVPYFTYTSSSWTYSVPDNDGRYSYEFSYQGKVNVSEVVGTINLNNKVTVDGRSSSTSTKVSGGLGLGIEKQYAGQEVKEGYLVTNWTSTITAPAGVEGIYLYDELPKILYNGGVFYDEYVEGSFQCTNDTDENLFHLQCQPRSGSNPDRFTVCFNADTTAESYLRGTEKESKTLQFTYQSRISMENVTALNYGERVNKAVLRYGQKSVSDTAVADRAGASIVKILKDLKNKKNPWLADGVTVPYVITINSGTAGDLTTLDQPEDIVIQDRFCSDVFELVEGSLTLKEKGKSEKLKISTEMAVDPENASYSILTIHCGNLGAIQQRGVFYLEYQMRLKAEWLKNNYNASLTVRNDATLINNGDYDWEDVTANANVLSKAIIQKAASDNNYVAGYQLKVNPKGLTLSTESVLTVTDEMSSNLSLVPGSLTVSRDGGGALDSGEWSYSYVPGKGGAANVLTLTVPDGKALTVTYNASVSGKLGDTVTTTNTATLSGIQKSASQEQKVRIEKFSDQGIGGSSYYINLRKTDAQTNAGLSGVKFRLERQDGDLWILMQEFTTGGDGTVRIEGTGNQSLAAGFTYRLQELAPANGYVMLTAPVVFTISESDRNHDQGYYVSGDTLEISNRKIQKTEVSVKKIWDDKNDQDKKRPVEIKVELYRGQGNDTPALYKTETLKADGAQPWSYTWKNLDTEDSNGTEWIYTVKEADVPDGYVTQAEKTGNDFVITNTRAADGQVVLEADKELEGRMLQEGQFTFTVYDENGTEAAAGKNDVNGHIIFTPIKYSKDGIYRYKIKETDGKEAGYRYDSTEFEVTVTVEKNGTQLAEPKVTYPEGGVIFHNVYEAKGTAQIRLMKSLLGTELKAGQFTFELTDTADKTVLQTVRNAEDGSVAFEMTYKKAGTYIYEVKEKIPENVPKGYEYDNSVYQVTVEVTDLGDGTLDTAVIYPENGITFRNSYSAEGSGRINVVKYLEGINLQDGQFIFELLDADGKVLAEAKNDAAGNVSFEQHYTQSGTYHYKVRERIPAAGADGYTYDRRVFRADVEVTDRGDGTLEAAVSYPDGSISFRNSYRAEGSARINAMKYLEGANLRDGQFLFELTDESGKVLAEARNDASGSISFRLDYTEPGTYYYNLQERIPADRAAGYTYDRSVYHITVIVTDRGNGTLAVAVNTDANDLVFRNVYRENPPENNPDDRTPDGNDPGTPPPAPTQPVVLVPESPARGVLGAIRQQAEQVSEKVAGVLGARVGTGDGTVGQIVYCAILIILSIIAINFVMLRRRKKKKDSQ